MQARAICEQMASRICTKCVHVCKHNRGHIIRDRPQRDMHCRAGAQSVSRHNGASAICRWRPKVLRPRCSTKPTDKDYLHMVTISSRNCLSIFRGEWAGEETIAPSKWGAGGMAVAVISARLDVNERTLIQDYSAERDGSTQPDKYHLTLESSFDGGATWMPVMNGKYPRTG
jgi:hypothetical protein